MNRRLLTCGDHAVMVEVDGLDEVLALNEAVRRAMESGEAAFAEVVDVVPAARTLLVVVSEGADLRPLRAALPTLSASPVSASPVSASPVSASPLSASPVSASTSASPARASAGQSSVVEILVEILVDYDGPDLQEISRLTGLTLAEVVAAHTDTPWRAAFAGFAPGFVYLTGGDSRLQVPRLKEPRTSVPAGAVALAGEFSAVYPRSSPGGWQLLGHTDTVLWDVQRQPPALLQPGFTVRFVKRS